MTIPSYLLDWFSHKGWTIHAYQQAMFAAFKQQESTLLIAPTGGGKTLASFLPALIAIHEQAKTGLHTLYISPLKALTADIERNLLAPITEMHLKVTVETRTGDTSSYRRQRQRKKPPNILLTTPESLQLLLSYPDSAEYFKQLKLIIIDELHSLAPTKRGDMTALALAKLNHIAPDAIRFGLSATIAQPDQFTHWLGMDNIPAKCLFVKSKQKPTVSLLTDGTKIPYSGFMAKYAISEIYAKIAHHQMTIVYVNTRAQTEFIFRQLWDINDQVLPIAIYHGSLDKAQRLKTESLTVSGKLKAIIATSALELGIDWGNVDCVIQVGAPKGISRLLQRIGRSNHQFDKASLAYLVPSNCFEALECQSAMDAMTNNKLDGEDLHPGSLDVVVQFIINSACAAPIDKQSLFTEIKSAYPYQHLTEIIYDKLFQFAVNGGYTLKHYEQYHRLLPVEAPYFSIASPKVIRRHRQNIGTIVEAARMRVKILFKRRSKIVGDIEEAFAQQLVPGDTFLFAGEVLEFVGVRDMYLEARKTKASNAKLPSYNGGTMPLSTYLAEDVRQLINNPKRWRDLPKKVSAWLELQRQFSILPGLQQILIEQFPYKKVNYFVIYSFEGRRANHTLGMLISQRMEHQGFHPLTFTATDYGLAMSSLTALTHEQLAALLDQDILFDELENWLQHAPLLKRTFRQVAIIAGLTERQLAGTRKSMKQVTFSTDLIYDVLMRHEPNHILLTITRADANRMLLDLSRLATMLERFKHHIIVQSLERPSPLSVPILTAIKTEWVARSAIDELLAHVSIEDEANELINAVKKTLS